jgi:predicted RNA-binding Zn-ribbon protein involved in translation (DUF1610 family)
MTKPYSSGLDKKRLQVIRIRKELKSELNEIRDTVFPFSISYNDVLSLWPRCPSCSALLLQIEKDGTLKCWKCGKEYKLIERDKNEYL